MAYTSQPTLVSIPTGQLRAPRPRECEAGGGDMARAQGWGKRSQVPGPLLPGCVPLGHSLNFSGPVSSSLSLHGAFIPTRLREQDSEGELYLELGGVKPHQCTGSRDFCPLYVSTEIKILTTLTSHFNNLCINYQINK